MIAEKIWWILTGACVAWYSTITIYVAFKGAFDIKHMLSRLTEANDISKDE